MTAQERLDWMHKTIRILLSAFSMTVMFLALWLQHYDQAAFWGVLHLIFRRSPESKS
jgi:hypothetical protein